ncbi:peptidylprolyl isomerase [Rasiella rasia]|uniref:Peptidylprolyl isomerase n=2 Tax=Rasiella rasia TaxID=2744027 RepID=A0A6G6GJZ1_9FLAO|nr:peptidylprolyl isomerase [Rasiella rasia]
MHLKITILKYMKRNNMLALLAVFTMTLVQAQESLVVENVETPTVQKDTVKPPFKRYKAEGVAAVVGDYVVLDSDIDKGYLEFQQQGISIEDITRCQLLGKLMEDKLYLHQAVQDSIVVVDSEINPEVDQLLQIMTSEIGSEEKLLKFYRKNSLPELRSELFTARKNLKLSGRMQAKVVENVEITPEEIREFFFAIPEDERPVFSAEVEVAQIVAEPQITKEAKQEAIDRLNQMREDILNNGISFATKAGLYSEDGSKTRGGLIEGVKRNSQYVKEFKDQAFSLLEGEISEPFETIFGFHILKVDKIRGQEIDVRHILIYPDVPQSSIDAAKEKMEKVRTGILDSVVTFAEAARLYSEEKETRNNGGILVNPVTYDTWFDLTKMDPELSAKVYNLKPGEVSKIFTERDRTGKATYKIYTVNRRNEEHPAEYATDYERIKELALKEKKIRAIEAWQNKQIKETYVSVNEDYQECEFSSDWIKTSN